MVVPQQKIFLDPIYLSEKNLFKTLLKFDN